MQLLLQQGCEGGDSAGLGYIEGAVQHLQNLGCQARLPHMGWNSVAYAQPHHLFAGVASESDWYFVHSYAVQTAHTESIIGQTEHDIVFTSVIAKDNVMGVQFHPEKSGKQGRKLLENFVVL
jgi:glutamine amidotransferase